MTTTTHTRLDDIAERNTRSRFIDLAFAAMVTILLVLGLLSLRAAASPSVSYSAVHAQPAQIAGVDAVCDVEATSC